MDIVAVVLNGPTQQEKQQPPNSSKTPNKNNSQRISILIGDYSLPQCARVSINVSSSCDTMALLKTCSTLSFTRSVVSFKLLNVV